MSAAFGSRTGTGRGCRGIEVEQGCFTATPVMVAAWQAQEVMKILAGIGEPLRRRMLLMDAEAGTVDIVRL